MTDLLSEINLTALAEQFVGAMLIIVPVLVALSLIYVFRDGIRDFFRDAFKGLRGK